MDRYIAIVEGIEYGISMNPHLNNDIFENHISYLLQDGYVYVYILYGCVYIYTIRHIYIFTLYIIYI